MGIRQEIEEVFKSFDFTKIEGQPTDESLNLLVRELTNAAASIPTRLGGGNHGHVGVVINEAEYITFSNGGATFNPATNPGAYPTTVDENNAAVREKQLAKHKELREVIFTHEAITHSMRTTIVNCVDEEWLAELRKCHASASELAIQTSAGDDENTHAQQGHSPSPD